MISQEEVQSIVRLAVAQYIKRRHDAVAGFVDENFRFRGAWRLNRAALGKDLLRTPANIAWAVPHTLAKATGSLAGKLGAVRLRRRLHSLPPGFATDVQREMEWKIRVDLLELPFRQGDRESAKDALLEEVLSHPSLVDSLAAQLARLRDVTDGPTLRAKLEELLGEYASSQTASAEIAGALLCSVVGAAAFKKFAPGALETGSAIAHSAAQASAISSFWAGGSLGALYYGVFPAAPSAALSLSATGGVIAVLGVLAAFSGAFTDPALRALGLQQRRLHKMIDRLEAALLKGIGEPATDEDFVLFDRYVARVLDLADVVAKLASSLSR